MSYVMSHVMWYHFISYVVSHVMSCHMTCHSNSHVNHVMSNVVSCHLLCHVMSHHVTSSHLSSWIRKQSSPYIIYYTSLSVRVWPAERKVLCSARLTANRKAPLGQDILTVPPLSPLQKTRYHGWAGGMSWLSEEWIENNPEARLQGLNEDDGQVYSRFLESVRKAL